jgi:PBP1b-binding outer membrane lipoprotein LpoB
MIKNILTVLALSSLLVACAQETEKQPQVTSEKPALVVPEKQPEVKPVPPKVEPKPQLNNNCVTKDKNGNCPPLPNSPRPTPKK